MSAFIRFGCAVALALFAVAGTASLSSAATPNALSGIDNVAEQKPLLQDVRKHHSGYKKFYIKRGHRSYGGKKWRGHKHWGGKKWSGRKHWGGKKWGGRKHWGGKKWGGHKRWSGKKWKGHKHWGGHKWKHKKHRHKHRKYYYRHGLLDDYGYYPYYYDDYRDTYYDRESCGAYEDKQRCADKYRSFEWDTCLYTTYSGRKRLCPYVD